MLGVAAAGAAEGVDPPLVYGSFAAVLAANALFHSWAARVGERHVGQATAAAAAAAA